MKKKWLFGKMNGYHPLVVSATPAIAYQLLEMYKEHAVTMGNSLEKVGIVLNLNNPEDNLYCTTHADITAMSDACKQESRQLVTDIAFRYCQRIVNNLGRFEEVEKLVPQEDGSMKEVVWKTLPDYRHVAKFVGFPRIIVADKAPLTDSGKFSYRLVVAPLLAELLHGKYLGEVSGFAYPGPRCGKLQMAVINDAINEVNEVVDYVVRPYREVRRRIQEAGKEMPALIGDMGIEAKYAALLYQLQDTDGYPLFPGHLDTDPLSDEDVAQRPSGYTTNGSDGLEEEDDSELDRQRQPRYSYVLDRSNFGEESGVRLLRCGQTLGGQPAQFNSISARLDMQCCSAVGNPSHIQRICEEYGHWLWENR
jgi:hypothetical protein